MGVTLFLTMKQSSGGMPQQSKVMLYTMNGMFVLLFNSFPAGLNLYYVVYNLLNYFQQRRTSQKKDDQDSSQKEKNGNIANQPNDVIDHNAKNLAEFFNGKVY